MICSWPKNAHRQFMEATNNTIVLHVSFRAQMNTKCQLVAKSAEFPGTRLPISSPRGASSQLGDSQGRRLRWQATREVAVSDASDTLHNHHHNPREHFPAPLKL